MLPKRFKCIGCLRANAAMSLNLNVQAKMQEEALEALVSLVESGLGE